jgi:hypothetical protein
MPAHETLYLFRTAQRPLDRRQNLHLIAAERGQRVALGWQRSLVDPAYFDADTIATGTPVVLVLTDRPYRLFVPVRAGEVVAARWEAGWLRLGIALGTWVRSLRGDLEAFTAGLRAAHAGALPGERLVVARRDTAALEPYFDEDEAGGWQSAVDGALALSAVSDDKPYASSVFFRPAGLRIGNEPVAVRHAVLAPGDRAELFIDFHNPHLAEAALATFELRAVAPAGALRVRGPSNVRRHGRATLDLAVLAPGAELALHVVPDAGRHTATTLRFAAGLPSAGRDDDPEVEGDNASADLPDDAAASGAAGDMAGDAAEVWADGGAAAMRSTDAAELRAAAFAAWETFRDNAISLPPERALPIVAAFAAVLPEEPAIAERMAQLLAATDDDVRAFQILRTLDPERLGADARFLLFRLHAIHGNVAAAVSLVELIDLQADRQLERLLAALDPLDGAVLGRLVRELSSRLADPAAQRALLTRVERRLTSPEHIAEVARNFHVATLDAPRAAAFLRERTRSLHLNAPVLAEALLELAEDGALDGDTDDLADLVAHRVINLIGRGDIEEALTLLRRAQRNLPRHERDRLYHRAADRLIERERREDAAGLLVELGYAAAETGDLAAAAEAMLRARGIFVAQGKTSPEWVVAAVQRVEAAWQDVEPIAETQANERERRAAALRDKLLDRSILIVGGFKRERFREPIARLTGASIDFGEHFRTEGDSLASLAERIRAGRYALVVFRHMFSGHDVSETLRKACADADVPFVFALGGGLQGVEEAVWRALGTD